MNPDEQNAYRVWAHDNLVYGPIDLDTLIQWVQEARVLPETWVHAQADNHWHRARDFAPLEDAFTSPPGPVSGAAERGEAARIDPGQLRQFPAFAGLANESLEEFASFGECRDCEPGELIVRKGDPSDAIYFVLSGAVRVRLLVGVPREDTTLCQIPAGEFFGELGMFLQSARTADVVAETPTRLLRVSANAFQLILAQAPALAAPILFAIAGTMARRIAEDNQRFYRERTSQYLWR